MRVYFNLLFLVFGLGGVALALGARTVSASTPGGTIPTVVVGVLVLLALAAALVSRRGDEDDLGRAFLLSLLGGGAAWLAGYLELGDPLLRGVAAAGAVTLPPLFLAVAISLRSGPSGELLRELVDCDEALENKVIAVSMGGVDMIPLLEEEIEASADNATRQAHCVELLAAFTWNQAAFVLAERAAQSPAAAVRGAALRALAEINPQQAEQIAQAAQDDPDPEVRAAAAALLAL